MRVALSGGGSGGHIFPALAVADSLFRLAPQTEMLYVGAAAGSEATIVPRAGLPFVSVAARKLRKVASPSTVLFVASLARGYVQARRRLKAFHADAVLSTGGYVSAAAALAGAHIGLPVIVLAPDSEPGRTNLLLARRSHAICLAFPETAARFTGARTFITGLPVRAEIVAPPEMTQQAARASFTGLDPLRFTVLVQGGSQGAATVNAVTLRAARDLVEAGINVLHVTGESHFAGIRQQASSDGLMRSRGYHPAPFLETAEMAAALRGADCVVSRGGMSSLAEVLVNGRPALIVPLPSAYADHQTHNARRLEAQGAARVWPQCEVSAVTLTAALAALRDDHKQLHEMAARSLDMARPLAADDVARIILDAPPVNH